MNFIKVCNLKAIVCVYSNPTQTTENRAPPLTLCVHTQWTYQFTSWTVRQLWSFELHLRPNNSVQKSDSSNCDRIRRRTCSETCSFHNAPVDKIIISLVPQKWQLTGMTVLTAVSRLDVVILVFVAKNIDFSHFLIKITVVRNVATGKDAWIWTTSTN